MEFLLCFVLGFGGGYFFGKKDVKTQEQIKNLYWEEQGSFPEDFNPD